MDPTSDPRWAQLTDGPRGSLFTSDSWLRVLRQTYGFDFSARVLLEGTMPVSGVASVRVDDIRGSRIVSLPFCDYADPVVSDASHWAVLADPLFEEEIPVRARATQGSAWDTDDRVRVANETRWHGVDLAPDLDAIWTGLGQSARRAVRKAEKNGVEIRLAQDLDDVRAFYDLHCGIRRSKYDMLTQPLELFENLWREFAPSKRFALLLAEVGDMVVGGTLYLQHGDTLYYKFNASLTDGLDVRPNDLLVWSGIVLGKERGLAMFDFGQSDLDQPGLLRFKEKYATHQRTIRAYDFVPEGWADPGGRAGAATLSDLTALLVGPGVSDEAYRHAGALLYRNFC